MNEYEQFLLENPRVVITAKTGVVTVKLDSKVIYTGKYVVGDYDDKLQETIRAYRGLVLALLETKPEVKV